MEKLHKSRINSLPFTDLDYNRKTTSVTFGRADQMLRNRRIEKVKKKTNTHLQSAVHLARAGAGGLSASSSQQDISAGLRDDEHLE